MQSVFINRLARTLHKRGIITREQRQRLPRETTIGLVELAENKIDRLLCIRLTSYCTEIHGHLYHFLTINNYVFASLLNTVGLKSIVCTIDQSILFIVSICMMQSCRLTYSFQSQWQAERRNSHKTTSAQFVSNISEYLDLVKH